MQYLSTVILLLISSAAFAHEDHTLGDGALHFTYHVVFWSLFAGAVFKGIQLYKSRKKNLKTKIETK